MSSGNSNNKQVFGKIRSGIQRSEVLKSAIIEKSDLICKGMHDSLFYFRPVTVMYDGSVVGEVILIEGKIAPGETIANFNSLNEKFFYQTKLGIKDLKYVLEASEKMYKLQRREHFRVGLSTAEESSVVIINHNGKKTFIDAECMDVSMGGARIQVSEEVLSIKPMDKIISVLRINGKRFEVHSEVRHLKNENGIISAGIQFSASNEDLKNRLQMLVLEFQRSIVSSL
jgi:hypothetical protein